MTVSQLFSFKMAVTMAPVWVFFFLSVIGTQVNASGELSILHSPDSLSFSGSSEVNESLLKEIFSATLGLSVEENSKWNGLLITDPFNTPEAVVEVYIDGVSNLGSSAGLNSKINYPLVADEYEPDTFDVLKHRINQRFTNGGNKIVNIKLSDGDQLLSYSNVFGDIVPKVKKQTQYLKSSIEEDLQFLSELAALEAITEKIQSKPFIADNIIDFFNFRITSLHALRDFHEPNSLQIKEAEKLLGEALKKLTRAFTYAYDGSVLVTVVTTDTLHTRRFTRSAPSNAELRANNVDEDGYSADYAAIFNIILWFGVVFTFTLIAIVYALMDMDPGRDSIIYRMTNTRMKKDN